jgi:hypothetical protein
MFATAEAISYSGRGAAVLSKGGEVSVNLGKLGDLGVEAGRLTALMSKTTDVSVEGEKIAKDLTGQPGKGIPEEFSQAQGKATPSGLEEAGAAKVTTTVEKVGGVVSKPPKSPSSLPEIQPPKSHRPSAGELATRWKKELIPQWARNIANEFRGRAAERLIRQQLTKAGAKYLHKVRIWVKTSKGMVQREVDFLIQFPDGSFIALEIKRGGSPYTTIQRELDALLKTNGGTIVSIRRAKGFGLPNTSVPPFETYVVPIRE